MEVILLERIRKLGQMGDVASVKDGFARNFLLPKGKALRANEKNRQKFEDERSHLEARNLELKTEASGVGEKLEGRTFIAIRQAGDTAQLYGSVSSRDIAELMTKEGVEVDRNQVLLNRPIRVLGLHDVMVSLHPEVEVKVVINVARTEEEAERQARGEDITIEAADEPEDEVIAEEEIFEEGVLEQRQSEEQEEAEAAAEADAEAKSETSNDETAGGDNTDDDETQDKE